MTQHRIFAFAVAVVATSLAIVATATRLPAAQAFRGQSAQRETNGRTAGATLSLPTPAKGKLPVAFVVGKGAEVLDFCGPLEVFAWASTNDGKQLFAPYIVAATLEPVTVGGGMRVVPDYTFKTAPAPKVIVIPAMGEAAATPEMIDWIRKSSASTDVTMSVCNGVFVLAKTGLLSGKSATSHHGGYFRFAGTYPDVRLKRGARFVEDGNIATAGGVSSGIDLALRVVQRYVGLDAASRVAEIIEYQGKGWLNPDSNEAFETMPALDGKRPLCPLCFMEGDPAIKVVHAGKTYYFCAESEKEFFESHLGVLDRFLAEDEARRAGPK
jgi:putative intracellular protease/amidase/YHS domain-containing protein